MPIPTYSPGQPLPSATINAMLRPTYKQTPDNAGEIPWITNADMSTEAGQILPEWQTFRDTLKVSAGTGLSVIYTGGVVQLPSGGITTIAPGTLSTLTNNATNFVYVNKSGTLEASTILPVFALLLASVVTAGGSVSSVSDRRPRFQIQPIQGAVRIFGGSGDEGDYTLNTGSATLTQGEYYFRNFTIGTTATLTLNKGVKIYCSGNVSIAGTVNVTGYSLGGGRVVVTAVRVGGNTGTGPGAGSGFSPGPSYPYGGLHNPQPGSGGAQGRMLSLAASNGVANASLPQGGAGGGYFVIEAAGSVTVSGAIVARGADGETLTQTDANSTVSGGGGGSGGLIMIASLTSISITSAATLDVRGGNGGAAQRGGTTGGAYGGGEGGGGYVVLMCPTITQASSNILLAAGSPGANAGTVVAGTSVNGVGGGGFGGDGGLFGSTPITAQAGQLVTRTFLPVA